MAVLPGLQRRGIGSRLVREGLARLRESGCPFVIVLGHPDYYPRFGFERASRYGVACPWSGVPDEAFLVLFFEDLAGRDVSGVALYRGEFDAAV
jgi:putative acetyltransferase